MIKWIFSVMLVLLLTVTVFCGCRKGNNASDNGSALEQLDSQKENESEFSLDKFDPQNTELYNGEGAVVPIGTVSIPEGKASGIDVSKWQGKINWKTVKKTGVQFAIIRIGFRGENGVIYKDSYADYNIQQADKAGILVGVYFFSTAITAAEAKEEAEWTASMIEGYPISYPVAYDCEGYNRAESRMRHLSPIERTQNAIAFLSHIENLGYEGMFYASKSEITINWDIDSIQKKYKIWFAHYPAVTYPDIKNPNYNGRYDMWQYTNKGDVAGIDGNTDMVLSYFVKEKATPKSQKKVETAEAPIEKDNIYTKVNDTVTAKETVNLREGAGTNFNIVAVLKNGEQLNRIATGNNGWSKLIYNGRTVYAITSFITTNLKYRPPYAQNGESVIYTTVNEEVTAKNETNLRTGATTEGTQVVYTLKNGEIVTRTGVSSNGWSRLLYNGQEVYAISSYLTTDLYYKPPVGAEETVTEDYGMKFTETNEKVTAKTETNLRTLPTTESDSEIVYTLKNGEYITRIGVSVNGWSKLLYNGQVVYAISSYLTK